MLLSLLPLTEDLVEYETIVLCLLNTLYPNYKPMVSADP